MADQSHRSSYKSDNVPWSKAVARRATRITIGQQLKALYQVQQDLPHEIFQLLMQLNARYEEK